MIHEALCLGVTSVPTMPSSPSPPPSPGALSSPPDIYLAALAGDAGLCAALLLRDGPSAPLANAQLVAPSAPLLERRRLIKLILRAMVRSAGWSGPGVTPAQLLFMSRKLEFALFHTHTPYVRTWCVCRVLAFDR